MTTDIKLRISIIIGLMILWIVLSSRITIIHLTGPTPDYVAIPIVVIIGSFIMGVVGAWAIIDLKNRK